MEDGGLVLVLGLRTCLSLDNPVTSAIYEHFWPLLALYFHTMARLYMSHLLDESNLHELVSRNVHCLDLRPGVFPGPQEKLQ